MAGKGKILIVDDDADFVKSTGMILETDGYEIVVASDGKMGLEKIKESSPDLVILDIMMESIFEGFSFLGTLRSAPEFAPFRAIPILMVSSVKRDTGSRFAFADEDSGMGDSAQPDDFLDKPLKAPLFLKKVSALISKSG
jgi:CheY-like chemotaxis protein